MWFSLLTSCSVLAGYLIVKALEENMNFFITPTQIREGVLKQDARVRLGGVVQKGSVIRDKGLNIYFTITDFSHNVAVQYSGILPDLFKEEKGVVVLGSWDGKAFRADQVLAKHDENYMPPEVKNALQ